MKKLTVTWDDEGGAHIERNPEHTLNDLRILCGSLGCIIVHNLYMDGETAAIERFFAQFRAGCEAYLADLAAGDTRGTRLRRVGGEGEA